MRSSRRYAAIYGLDFVLALLEARVNYSLFSDHGDAEAVG